VQQKGAHESDTVQVPVALVDVESAEGGGGKGLPDDQGDQHDLHDEGDHRFQ